MKVEINGRALSWHQQILKGNLILKNVLFKEKKYSKDSDNIYPIDRSSLLPALANFQTYQTQKGIDEKVLSDIIGDRSSILSTLEEKHPNKQKMLKEKCQFPWTFIFLPSISFCRALFSLSFSNFKNWNTFSEFFYHIFLFMFAASRRNITIVTNTVAHTNIKTSNIQRHINLPSITLSIHPTNNFIHLPSPQFFWVWFFFFHFQKLKFISTSKKHDARWIFIFIKTHENRFEFFFLQTSRIQHTKLIHSADVEFEI